MTQFVMCFSTMLHRVVDRVVVRVFNPYLLLTTLPVDKAPPEK